MPLVQQGFDRLLATTALHLAVVEARLMVKRRVFVGVAVPATHLAAERLLLDAIGARDEVTA
jgi:hypothetical protein